jgi:AAA+ ATPase superfamily predicted ATPase
LKAYGAKYSIKDNFFDFWFRFVYTNLSELERGDSTAVTRRIQKEFPVYLGKKFERIMIDIFPQLDIFSEGRSFTGIGRWWHKDKEIDIVALNENTTEIVFCECKWQNRETGAGVLEDLLNKSKYVRWNDGARVEQFMVISRSGFTRKAVDYARDHNIILLTHEEIWKIFV